MITAGPTCVPIDKIRVISNTATGETGILLAKKFARQGAQVTLLLAGGDAGRLDKRIKVIPFKFFDELAVLLQKRLKQKHYQVIIHSAAVSDYQPQVRNKKISSDLKRLSLTLKPTPKIINTLRRLNRESFLVGFKFELGLKSSSLIKEARSLLMRGKLDLVVANTAVGEKYLAYLVSANKASTPILSKEKLVNALTGLIRRK